MTRICSCGHKGEEHTDMTPMLKRGSCRLYERCGCLEFHPIHGEVKKMGSANRIIAIEEYINEDGTKYYSLCAIKNASDSCGLKSLDEVCKEIKKLLS